MSYGDTDSVIGYMESIVPVADSGTTITPDEIESDWLPRVDRLIHAHLRAHYVVPFRKLGPEGEGQTYPLELVEAASMWCAGLIIQERFSQAEPNASDRANQLITAAIDLIDRMKSDVNTARLPGQTRRSHDHFSDPALMPSVTRLPGGVSGTVTA